MSSKVKVNDSLMLFEHLLSHDYSTPSLFKGDAQSPNPSSKKIYPVLISIQLTVLFKKTAEYSSAHSPIKRMSNPSRPSPVPLGHSVLRSILAVPTVDAFVKRTFNKRMLYCLNIILLLLFIPFAGHCAFARSQINKEY